MPKNDLRKRPAEVGRAVERLKGARDAQAFVTVQPILQYVDRLETDVVTLKEAIVKICHFEGRRIDVHDGDPGDWQRYIDEYYDSLGADEPPVEIVADREGFRLGFFNADDPFHVAALAVFVTLAVTVLAMWLLEVLGVTF